MILLLIVAMAFAAGFIAGSMRSRDDDDYIPHRWRL